MARSEMCDLARHRIAQLRGAGHTVTDDDVVRLNALACEIETPARRRELARGRPVQAGGYWLWPLTCAAHQWWIDNLESFGDSVMALAYAMAYTGEDIETKTAKDVAKFGRSMRVNRNALREIVEQIVENDSPSAGGGTTDSAAAFSPCELARVMHVIHGGTPEMWERHVSVGYIRAYLATALAQARAGSEGGRDLIRDKANYDFACACEAIEKRGANG